MQEMEVTTSRLPRKPDLQSGLAFGAMLTAALMAISYSAWTLAGVSFLPFEVFDSIVSEVPGFMLTLGIDSMISLIAAVGLGTTAGIAKVTEQLLAILGTWVAGTAAGGLLFALLRFWRSKFATLLGALVGVAAGIVAAVVCRPLHHSAEPGDIANTAWIVSAFVIWGLAIGWSYRHQRVARVRGRDRRHFVAQFGGAMAAITLGGLALGKLFADAKRELVVGDRWSDHHTAPNAGAAVRPSPRTRPELTPLEEHYRVDINTIAPAIHQDEWSLEISGLVEKPTMMTLDQLRKDFRPLDQFVTLSCISNPVGGDLIGAQRWTGVSFQRLLPLWRLKPEATHLKIRSADGFFEVVSLESIRTDERAMLTYAWDGLPLTRAHGFPLRIFIPDTYGMKMPKWIMSIEATDHWEPGYWVTRGWDAQAVIQPTAVIDGVGAGMMVAEAREGSLVPIGGIAYAGARGVSKVEIQIDNGEWVEAQLREPLSPLTWVIWRYDWPLRHGLHTFRVRCYDGAGAPQMPNDSVSRRDGSTGLHSKTMLF